MQTPSFEIKVNGKPVASIMIERLISLSITDKEGVGSDSIDVDLNDGHPFGAIPKKGDKIEASIGYKEDGLIPFGSYTIDEPEIRCLPYGMSIKGRGANVRDQLKQSRVRHWDNKTVGDILRDIAKDNNLTPVIDEQVAAHKYPWFGQQNESDMHVAERLARLHGGLFSVKEDKLIFTKRGSGKSASGKDLTPIVATPADIVPGTCRINFAYRKKVRKVKAKTRDRLTAETVEIEEDSDDEGTADFTIKDNFASPEEAKLAAKSKADQLKSETVTTTVTLVGNPAIRAGAPFSYAGVRPEVDGVEFIIETAVHKISKSGYFTDVTAKLKPAAKASTSTTGNSTGNSPGKQPSQNTSKTPELPTPSPSPSSGSMPGGFGIGRA